LEIQHSHGRAFAKASFIAFATYQAFLLDPAVRISIINNDGRLTDLGPSAPAIVRHWKAGWTCQVTFRDGLDVAVDCPYAGNGSVQDGLNSFRYTLCALDGKFLLASADKGAQHQRQLTGSELIKQAQQRIVSEN
jgi:hypothetical protein